MTLFLHKYRYICRKLRRKLGNNLKGYSTRSLEKLRKLKLMMMKIKSQVKSRKMVRYRKTHQMERIRRIHMKLHLMQIKGVGSLTFGLPVIEFFHLLGFKDVPYYNST